VVAEEVIVIVVVVVVVVVPPSVMGVDMVMVSFPFPPQA